MVTLLCYRSCRKTIRADCTTDSVAGHVVYQQDAVYCGTKFAVRAIMEGLRLEERESNIRSMLISPGTVDTEHTTVNCPGEKGMARESSAH